jgi:hypothetical protein
MNRMLKRLRIRHRNGKAGLANIQVQPHNQVEVSMQDDRFEPQYCF